ncbi:MAG TPA: DUF4149 domain-containing protein [Pyrinomonadaceae bacterium]|jgi:hypothetical protein
MKFLSDIRLLLTGLWLGASVFFVGVAQAAFAVLPQKELAGSVVGRSLSIIDYAGIAIAAIMIVTSILGSARVNKFWLWIERFLWLVVGAACAVEEFVLGTWMSSIRSQMSGPIDDVAADNPLKLQFDQLHQYSEWVFMGAMIAALITFFIIANRAFGAGKVDKKGDIYDFSKEFKT